jgi:hypothetical protein
MGAPLATVALFNAVLFAARGQMQQLLQHTDGKLYCDVAGNSISSTSMSLLLHPASNLITAIAAC